MATKSKVAARVSGRRFAEQTVAELLLVLVKVASPGKGDGDVEQRRA